MASKTPPDQSRSNMANNGDRRRKSSREWWYLPTAVLLLLGAAFFREWKLGSVPPGMHDEELINAQLSDEMRQGDVSVIYDETEPAREGVYYALLAASTALTGRGLILWRMPSVWLGMLSLAMMTRLMGRLFGDRVSLMALGLAAISFWPVWMGRSIQHIAALPLATTVVIYAFTRAFQSKQETTASLWFTIGGLALGAAQYVHVTAWTLLVLYFVVIICMALIDREIVRKNRANIIYALTLCIVLALPLVIYIARHPGVREVIPITEQTRLIVEAPRRILTSLAALVLRGDMLPQHNLPGRPVFEPVSAALMMIGIGVALARWRKGPYGLVLLWLVIGLIPTAFHPHTPDFEFMGVLLPVIYVFPAIGLSAVYDLASQAKRDRLKVNLQRLVSLSVAGIIIANAGWTYRDYFVRWPSLGDVRLNYQADLGLLAHYLDTSQDPSPISVCSTPVDRGKDPFALTNAELLSRYLLHRHDRPIRYFDCTQSLVLANGGESQLLIFPRGHYYDRLPGQLLAWMRYADDEQVPGIRPDVIMRLEASEEIASYMGAFTTEAMAAWPPPPESNGELASLPVPFGYNITLLGYDIRDDHLRAGDWVELTTYWRVDGPPPTGMTVFTHLLSNPVVVVAQTDSLGVQTGTLQVRDIFIQNTLIGTPVGMSKGEYPLSVGLYFPGSGERLSAFEGDQAMATRLFLRSVTIEP